MKGEKQTRCSACGKKYTGDIGSTPCCGAGAESIQSESDLTPGQISKLNQMGWKLVKQPSPYGDYWINPDHPFCQEGAVIHDEVQLEEILGEEWPFSPARAAYEVACRAKGYGDSRWNDLPQASQDAWDRIANAAIDAHDGCRNFATEEGVIVPREVLQGFYDGAFSFIHANECSPTICVCNIRHYKAIGQILKEKAPKQ